MIDIFIVVCKSWVNVVRRRYWNFKSLHVSLVEFINDQDLIWLVHQTKIAFSHKTRHEKHSRCACFHHILSFLQSLTWFGAAKFCVNLANWFTFTLANDVVNGEKFIFESWKDRWTLMSLMITIDKEGDKFSGNKTAWSHTTIISLHHLKETFFSHLKVILIVIHHVRFRLFNHLENFLKYFLID